MEDAVVENESVEDAEKEHGGEEDQEETSSNSHQRYTQKHTVRPHMHNMWHERHDEGTYSSYTLPQISDHNGETGGTIFGSPDSFLGLEEVVEEVLAELTGCSGRAAATVDEISQGEIVTRTTNAILHSGSCFTSRLFLKL